MQKCAMPRHICLLCELPAKMLVESYELNLFGPARIKGREGALDQKLILGESWGYVVLWANRNLAFT